MPKRKRVVNAFYDHLSCALGSKARTNSAVFIVREFCSSKTKILRALQIFSSSTLVCLHLITGKFVLLTDHKLAIYLAKFKLSKRALRLR